MTQFGFDNEDKSFLTRITTFVYDSDEKTTYFSLKRCEFTCFITILCYVAGSMKCISYNKKV